MRLPHTPSNTGPGPQPHSAPLHDRLFAPTRAEKVSNPAGPGFVRVFRDAGFRSDSPDAPGATAPTFNPRWEFYLISAEVASALKSERKSAMVPRAGMGKTLMTTFTAYIEFDEESQLYVGVVPGVPGAHTQASSLDELRANLQEVLELCLEEQGDLRAQPPKFVGVQQIEIA
jgi:predicted RNase H-like HicB family nuclease